MGVEYNQISKDAQRALEEFSEEFSAALAQSPVEQWAKERGLYRPSRALKTTFPIPVSAAGYEEFKGDVKYRSLFQKSLELIPKTWQDGVAELAATVEAPDFIGWTEEPARIAMAGASLANEIIAGLLEANPVCWDGENFFDTSHPYNVFETGIGTFTNIATGTPGVTALSAAKQNFREIKAANGKPLGLRMTHLLVPAAQEEAWKDVLEQDMVIQAINAGAAFGAVNNRHKGTVELIVSDELTDEGKFYPLALNKPGMWPWLSQDEGSPEEIRSDKSSALYATTLKVGVAYILRGNGALALPHCIQMFDHA
jgi:phage major head subunit gpT-like protein